MRSLDNVVLGGFDIKTVAVSFYVSDLGQFYKLLVVLFGIQPYFALSELPKISPIINAIYSIILGHKYPLAHK